MARISTTKTQRRFHVARDDAGVPHIDAPSWHDALYALGYMHAVDRPTQLLFSRVVAEGRGTELIADKEEFLETDAFFRRIGLHLDLDETVSEFPDETLDELAAYCDGINDGIRSRRRTLPMWATGFRPDEWNPAAVVLVGRLLSFGGLAISQLQNERLLIELIHAGADEASLREMFEPRLDDADFELIRQVKISNSLSDDAMELIVDLPRLAGSNAWAVAPQRSGSGRAMLASDPHLEINRLPAIWYECVLKWDGQYILGATLPGCPLYSVARTPKLSWGVTYMKGDTIDFFIEDCRQKDGSWQYRRTDCWHDFVCREERIKRKGSDPQVVKTYENKQGTLEGDPNQSGNGYYLSTAWAGRRVSSALAVSTWLNLMKANTVQQGMEIVRECTQPTLCFVMADSEGHIGMQGCGSFPKREKPYWGLAPLPAWEPRNHWQGWLPKSALPHVYDPPEGFVATANEENNREGEPMLVTQTVHDYRVRRIQERLRELPQATVPDMQSLQYDTLSLQARELLEEFLPHMPNGPHKDRLTAWDCRYEIDSREASLFQALYRSAMMELIGNERGIGWRRVLYLCSRAGFSSMVLTAADRLWHKKESWWWHGRNKADMIAQAAERINNMEPEPWGDVNYFHFVNRFFGAGRVGRLLGYRSRRKPMRGCYATPFQGHVYHTARRETTFAPSYHFVTDFVEHAAHTNLPGGPTESPFSKYYRADVPIWLEAVYKRLSPAE